MGAVHGYSSIHGWVARPKRLPVCPSTHLKRVPVLHTSKAYVIYMEYDRTNCTGIIHVVGQLELPMPAVQPPINNIQPTAAIY